jgi:hypothetical protein
MMRPMLTQAVLGPFGVADAAARRLLLTALPNGGYPSEGLDLVQTVRRAFSRMPAAARGPATTAAFAWAKRYVDSPAFASAYAEARNAQKPVDAPATNADAEVKKYLDQAAEGMAMSRQIAASLPPAERDKLLAQIKEQETQLKSPENLARLRATLGLGVAANAESAAAKSAEWAAKFPAEAKVFVRGCLDRFIAATTNVDFSLPTHWIRNASGDIVGFQSPGYEGVPWEHVHAILAGKDALTAARAAVDAWLKELR